jgi:hypothetical protein
LPRALRAALAGAAALAAALAVLALAAPDEEGTPAGSGRGLPAGFFGIVSEDAFGHPGAYRERSTARQAAAGVELVRQTFDWARIERRPARYDFSFYDRYVATLARHGLRVLPVLFNPPRFRSSAPVRGRVRGTYPPRRPEELGAFGAALARRYGPRGAFWRAHPGLPRLPVRAWQVWNEPSLRVYWPPEPDPAAYVRLLRATGKAIKRVDPGAKIVTAGLPQSELGVPLERYLEGMYDAGARGAFDVLALNVFAPRPHSVLAAIEAARGLTIARGDAPELWLTEFGWATGGPPSDFRVSEAEQAAYLRELVGQLVRSRRRLGLRGVVYFNWRDSLPYLGGREFFGLHTGLLRRNGAPKPALSAYQAAARR